MGSLFSSNGNGFAPGKAGVCSGCVRKDERKRCKAGVTSLPIIGGKCFCGRKQIAANRILPPQKEGKFLQQKNI